MNRRRYRHNPPTKPNRIPNGQGLALLAIFVSLVALAALAIY